MIGVALAHQPVDKLIWPPKYCQHLILNNVSKSKQCIIRVLSLHVSLKFGCMLTILLL